MPFLAPIISMLTQSGLNLLGKALGAGEEKVTSLIEEKTGIKLAEKNELSQDDILALKKFEADNELELSRIALADKQEDNRHSEVLYTTAHTTYQSKSDMADTIAKQIIERNLPLIGILVLVNVAILNFLHDNATLIAIASNLIGIAIGNLFNERQAIINFFFGSSLGSKIKGYALEKGATNGK